MVSTVRFQIRSFATLGFITDPKLDGTYTLSPFVWRDARTYRMLVRLVNRSEHASEKVSRIHAASSTDGVVFAIEGEPTLAPTPGTPDAQGCEDPTVVVTDSGTSVFYSGWNAETQSSTLLVADGTTLEAIHKRGEAIANDDAHANIKEATVVRCGPSAWALFFEYAANGASRIGIARASSLRGPWRIDPTFDFPHRPNTWDAWHLSPGPIVGEASEAPTMFYNGGNADGAWRIGWVTFDRSYSRIVDRCDAPLVLPPLHVGDESDIAFASSAVERDDTIELYYSVADKTPKCAFLVRN